MSPELSAFKKDFEQNCSVKVVSTAEDRNFFHWKRLIFNSINCEEMNEISNYIKKTFTEIGLFNHLAPKLGVYEGHLSLTVDVQLIQKKLIKDYFEMARGMQIVALKDLRGKSTCWNQPEMIDIPKGTVLEVYDNANNGDVFAYLIKGECTVHLRGNNEGKTSKITPRLQHPTLSNLILNEGTKSRHPYDFGTAQKDCWKIVK